MIGLVILRMGIWLNGYLWGYKMELGNRRCMYEDVYQGIYLGNRYDGASR